MSTTRLTFLYPHLFRSMRVNEPAAQTARRSCQRSTNPCRRGASRSFTSTSRKRDQIFTQRHGKAVEPFLAPGETEENTKVYVSEEVKTKKPESTPPETPKKVDTSSSAPLSQETQDAAFIPGDPAKADAKKGDKFIADEMRPKAVPKKKKDAAGIPAAPSTLETVLHIESPADVAEKDKPPHLQTPPYVHHFDTYTLVNQLEGGGFTGPQAVTAMKAVRVILASNLDVAKESLISKSDVENETYLFKAACSELKTEVQNARKLNDEKMRRERTLLEHEVEILNQKLTQDMAQLRDELKGMFDDRRMTVRMEQRNMDTAIQGLNYKITVDLSSDAKSDVEGLRWLVSRRAALGILIMAFMVLCSLRYAKYREHLEEEEKRRRKRERLEKEMKMREPPAVGALEGLAAN